MTATQFRLVADELVNYRNPATPKTVPKRPVLRVVVLTGLIDKKWLKWQKKLGQWKPTC